MGKIEEQVSAKNKRIDELTSEYISELKSCIEQLDEVIANAVEARNAVFASTAEKIKVIGDKMEELA